MVDLNLNEKKNEEKKEEKKEKKEKELKYSVSAVLTKNDIGKEAMITTILNSQIMGKITQVGQFEIEVQTKDGRRIIVFKHAIVSMYFFEHPDTKGVKMPTYGNP